MRAITTLVALGTMAWGNNGIAADACPQALDFEKRRLAGDEVVNLCDAYKGKVVDYFTNITSPESGKVISAIERLL